MQSGVASPEPPKEQVSAGAQPATDRIGASVQMVQTTGTVIVQASVTFSWSEVIATSKTMSVPHGTETATS